ncbi:MAG TPA: dTDP-4-dehydrorhamnose 3,5-epimerase [Chitinophagales bacterium]|nr:dTDP-4-dehydrorhamnose 3,5-epimerase [Chitinophagales bacterium]MCB9075263.1 dTDP-4-dehydrorhamnose 3,5-epimerase [Chitinophagales bacterium]HMY41486.1 dTDP-4-dehydrorhamnose 3,5-epimerase [Chitinophagales bacterium]HMZ68688.1 dTDP-4-dehydrorhamnose 3,5-epimerase [Chitinophagales bacterium]HND46636.1 dTDP-4-dehydrorhamnose 3,5-epimerase [Chitinophagales bacterium]
MKVSPTNIPDLLIIEPAIFEDERGFFYESYNQQKFLENGLNFDFVQDNHSKSTFGVLRGLHFQTGIHAQTKLVRVIQGCVIDVAVDLRIGSPTYLQSFSIELSAENKKQLLIPKGFAHGFLVITENCEFIYKCDALYNKEADAGVYFNDPSLNIDWGNIEATNYIISEKDKNLPLVNNAYFYFPFEKYTNTL